MKTALLLGVGIFLLVGVSMFVAVVIETTVDMIRKTVEWFRDLL